MLKSSQGLTLIELLAVIAIISILAVASMVLMRQNIHRARDSQRKNDLEVLSSAVEQYYDDNENEYPAEEDMNSADNCNSTNSLLEEYVKKFPCDPVTKEPYTYIRSNEGQIFYIYTSLWNVNDPAIADVGCTSLCGPASDRVYNYGVSSKNTRVGDAVIGDDSPAASPSPSPTLPVGTTPPSGTCVQNEYDSGCNPFGCYSGVYYRALCSDAGDWCAPVAYEPYNYLCQ